MKVNLFLVLLALLAGTLIGYGFHASGVGMLQTMVSYVLCTLFLATGMGLSVEGYPRTTTLMKTVALGFFLLTLGLNILLIAVGTEPPACIITNGLLALITLTIVYLIVRNRQ